MDRCLSSFLIALTILFTSSIARSQDSTTQPSPKYRVVLAGDSTVTDKSGWGVGFKTCLTDDIQLTNMALGGRSSKSFIAEGSWQKCLDLKPDYILIQFGHNDQPGHGPKRETDAPTTYRKNMERYVDDARAAGIKPILVTSMSRRQWGADGKIHSTLQPYVDVVKQIASEKHVPLIDLHARSIELYERIGKDAVNDLSPMKNADPASPNSDTATTQGSLRDGTHLNPAGSIVIGRIVADELKKAVPDLMPFIK